MGIDAGDQIWDLDHHGKGHNIPDCTDALVSPSSSGPVNLRPHESLETRRSMSHMVT